MKKLLIIDDDSLQLNYFSTMLASEFKIATSNNATSAVKTFSESIFAAVIINVHKPIINGFEFIDSINKIKSDSKPAIFILNIETTNEIKIRALRLGVKDFICPKMPKEEIVLRIKNQLNTANHSILPLTKTYKNLEMNHINLVVIQAGKKLELTLLEFKLLSLLMTHQQEIVSRNDLKEFAWPKTLVHDKTLNTHMSNLRSKLNTNLVEIKSIKGEGFILI